MKIRKSTTNNLYELEVASIIESVNNKWKYFKRLDLLEFSNAIDTILQMNTKDADVINMDDNDFIKYRDKIIPQEFERQEKSNSSPIPRFIVGRNRKSDSFTIISIEQTIYLTPKNSEFNIFLVYKLALMKGNLIKPCIEYLIKKYYKRNSIVLLENLGFLLADHASVFGERKNLLAEIFAGIKKDVSEVEKKNINVNTETVTEINPQIKSENIAANNASNPVEIENEINEVNGISLRLQVMFLHFLIEACRVEYEEEPTKSDKARIIHYILGKKEAKSIAGTNTYKCLDKMLTANETTNVKNLQITRSIFEKLMLRKPIELINKELKNWLT